MVQPRIICALLIAVVVLAATPGAVQQKPSRLVVVNQTDATVELLTFVDKAWQSQGRINPGASTSVYNVTNGQEFRARWGSQSRPHIVKLGFDRDYGGWQDIFHVK
jgi:hypothetical protein